MRTKLFILFLLFISTSYAQIKISYRVCEFPTLSFTLYTINNMTQDVYYSWIREKEDLSDENEIKYHFFKRHRDFSLYNLIVDVEDYESSLSLKTPECLLVKIRPGEQFTYVSLMRYELLPAWIFTAKEEYVEKIIQSSIPKRLIYNANIYFVMQCCIDSMVTH